MVLSAAILPALHPRCVAVAAHRRGLTLVEVLVVLAILLILSGLLVPAVGAVRTMLQRGSCANHLRQVGLAVQLYANDHAGLAPGSKVWGVDDPARSIAWFHRLPSYHGLREVGASGIFQCPAYRWPGPRGSSGLGRDPPKSYKMNAAIDSQRGRYAPFTLGGCSDAGHVALFVDGDTGTGMGLWGHAPPAALDDRRHGGAVNVLCADGRVVRMVQSPPDHRWATAITWRSADWGDR